MLSDCQIGLHGLSDEKLIGLCLVVPTHDVNELLGQFEIGALKAHVFARGPIEDEPEIDVDDVAPIIDHDVAIVSVLDLKDVANHRIGREGFYEVEPCKLEFIAVLVPELFEEILVQIDLKGLAQLISRVGVRYTLNDTPEGLVISSTVADALIRGNKEVEVALFEDLLEKCDNLESDDVLSKIIVHLEDARDNANVRWL